MARERKQIILRTVDEAAERLAPVVRVQNNETERREKPVRLAVAPEAVYVSQRLAPPQHEELAFRTHQPGVEALMDPDSVNPILVEQDWGKKPGRNRTIPWGWFVLILIGLASGIIWSLSHLTLSTHQADQILADTASTLEKDARAEAEATLLISRIASVTKQFFRASTIEDLMPLVRHPDRVRPLMEHHYAANPISASPIQWITQLQPVPLDDRANFWSETVELPNKISHNLLLEILDSGEPLIDWEAFVHLQPMDWDAFAIERPTGSSLDFRVNVREDHFFSHEFANSKEWSSFRLTALNGNHTLFGYAKANEEISKTLIDLVSNSPKQKASVILRVNIPEGLRSRTGVIIEKILSPRWFYLDPPKVDP